MTLRKREVTGTFKKNELMAFSGELALEGAMDLS
jgi:hypothetical protein